jgi:hypothetical protein
MAGLNGPQSGLVDLAELRNRFTRSEQPRLLDRRMDLLRVGYGQAGTAGQSLMNTGGALARSLSNIGDVQADARMQNNNIRQQMIEDALGGASYGGLYAYNKSKNGGLQWR